MKKNYLSKTAMSANPLAMIVAKKSWKNMTTTWLLLLFTVFGFTDAFGQRDDCDNNTGGQLSVNSTCTPQAWNSNNDTSYWNGATGCNSGDRDDAWGWFIATSTSTTITYQPANNRDAILHLFTGPCDPNMTSLACSDNIGDGVAETITYATTIGVRYRVRIQRYNHNGNMNGTICVYSLTPPTITSFTPSSACASSSQTVVITGTNFTGATAVTIGGIAAASYVVDSATQITATIGTGTTGTIQVTTPGGTATSATNFTVNPLPASPGNPTSNSPQCNPPGVTLTRTGTPPAGATWYWQTVAGGTSTANSAATFVATTSGTYYLRAQNNTTGCWSAGSGSVAVTITPTLSTAAATPNPTNTATGVCYAGAGAVTSISWGAVAGATSYDVYFGAGSVPATVTANVTTNSYPFGTLTPNTTYYWRIVAKNACGDAPTSATFSFTTSTEPVCYCTPSSNAGNTRYIESVSTTGYITDISNPTTGLTAGGYANYTALPPVTQIPGGGVTIDYYLQTSRQFVKIWVDWNNDGVFTDAAPELVYTTGSVQTIAGAGGFVIPPATLPGNYRIRIRSFEASQTFGPCGYLATGETEDYTLTVVADCPAKVTSAIDGSRCDAGSVVLGVQGTVGVTQYRFYDAQYGGTLIGSQAAVPGTTNWNTPALATTTTYYVSAVNGACESWYREPIIATINPVSNITVTPSTPEICGENNIVQISASGDFVIDYLVDEDFEGGGFGALTRVNINANANTQWTNRPSPYVPAGSVWKPAVTSKTIGNRFVLANSDFGAPYPKDTQLRTAVLNTSAFSDLFLDFRHYFSYYPGEPAQFADVDVSTNGGGAWTNIAQYVSNQGFAGQFNDVTLDLSAYAGLPSVMIRFRYHLAGGSAWADGWALDDVKIYGTRPLNTTFTWSGGTVDAFIDAGCTVPYVTQSVTTVYVRPTALQLASSSWSFTANATLGNGCPVSQLITINNRTKLWKGTVDNNWYNPNNWEPVGVPDANTCVFIYPGSPASNTSNINTVANDAFARSVTVRPSGVLNIHPLNDLTVTDAVTVDAGGVFHIENSGSLIQINNVANTGDITMDRNAVTNSYLDYVYWSTPVDGFVVDNITPPSNHVYQWEPTVPNAYAGDFGIWTAASGAMTTGRGYIIRGSSGISTFDGVPNNGDITTPISRSTYQGAPYAGPTSPGTMVTEDDDNWNLLGNPYPSAISADDFLTVNNTHLEQFVKIWTHGIDPAAVADPFYQDFVLNYDVADYITYNALGPSQPGFDGYIGAGQGFFVLMTDAASTSENVTFNNSMRSNTYRNDQFFRNSSAETIEKHRIWLKMIAPSGDSSDMLVGYTTNASNGLDAIYDTKHIGVKTNYELYSIAENQGLVIQGKSLPFDNNDTIPLGYVVPSNGIYTIAIDDVDGLFKNTNQNIYLEDKLLGIIHDLKIAPYSFTANTGRVDNRFELRYTNNALSQESFDNSNAVYVYTNENNINIKSNQEKIKNVTVFDLLGREIYTNRNVNGNELSIQSVTKSQSGLIVSVTIENGKQKTFKIIY